MDRTYIYWAYQSLFRAIRGACALYALDLSCKLLDCPRCAENLSEHRVIEPELASEVRWCVENRGNKKGAIASYVSGVARDISSLFYRK